MLSTNIKTLRKSQGLSQEELALKLHVVRQTISKWEKGLSVPDSDMLLELAEILDVPVSALLGEDISEQKPDEVYVLAQKLELINLQLAEQKRVRYKTARILLYVLCVVILGGCIFFGVLNGSYLEWSYADPELAVMGVGLHAVEWIFIRTAPVAFVLVLCGLWHLR
ncbi:helix-turn-helix domain-containing protein [Atopobium fossor]|uniref:helix-turn-helix domain-containing protein n=1 Tax=Atopobium fossor TaxID=39487 RepID=UPI0004282EE4|nr:helix-turn-helix transcriptional regulator [Atopobium fossor]